MGGSWGLLRGRVATVVVLALVSTAFLVPVEAAGVFVVQGTVTDVDGAPISGALVQSFYYADLSATTDENGRYRLEYLTPASDYLEASAPGRNPHGRYIYADYPTEPVDFFLSLQLISTFTPPRTTDTAARTFELVSSTGPKDGVCMRAQFPGFGTTELTMTQDSRVTGTASRQFSTSLAEGRYTSLVTAYRCDNPRFTLGANTYSLLVDRSAPSLTGNYPVPGSTVPADEVIPSFRLTDASGVVPDTVRLTLTDMTAGLSRELSRTSSPGGFWKGDPIQVVAGHRYVLGVDAADQLGTAAHVEWEFFGGDPVPTPTITKTAPYDYGERCERVSAVLHVTSSCLSEPSAIRDGVLRLAFSENRAAGSEAATAGYRFMGAGIKYTVPRTGDIEATADFAYADGKGLVCILVFGASEGQPLMTSCSPFTETQVKFQFRATTGQALRIGGYLLPECVTAEGVESCQGAAIARLDKVTVEFRGTP